MQFQGWALGFHIQLTRPPTHPLRPVNPNNARHLCITAAAGTELAVASSGGTINPTEYSSAVYFPLPTGVYNPKAFILHAASLCQAFAHCKRFSTAASRRSLGSVSVPVLLTILSDQLMITALVSRYPTNKLIIRRLLPKRQVRRSPPLVSRSCDREPHSVLIRLSAGYSQLEGRLPTRY